MGQKMTIYDDMDESEDDVQPCPFSVADATFHIDLGPENRKRFFEALLPFIQAARRHSGRVPNDLKEMLGPTLPAATANQSNAAPGPAPRRDSDQGGQYNKEVRTHHTKGECTAAREWADTNGIIVGQIGQIPLDVWEAFYGGDPSLVKRHRLRMVQD